MPWILTAAETEAALGAYRDALATLQTVRPAASGADLARLLALRADLFSACADLGALNAYREALEVETDPAARKRLRRGSPGPPPSAGDLETAATGARRPGPRRQRQRRHAAAGPRQPGLLPQRLHRGGRGGGRGAAPDRPRRAELAAVRPGRPAGPAGALPRRVVPAAAGASCATGCAARTSRSGSSIPTCAWRSTCSTARPRTTRCWSWRANCATPPSGPACYGRSPSPWRYAVRPPS